MATVLITGGTGLVGRSLGNTLLEKGYDVIVLSRNAKQTSLSERLSYASWDVKAQVIDKEAIGKADYIVHLAGAGVAEKRWTAKRKQEIIDSRTESSRLIVNSLKETPNKTKAVISASAIGWYGADPQVPNPSPFTEEAQAAKDFLGTTCLKWEDSIRPVEELEKRLVILRIGIVLSRDGGALREFLRPMKRGVAATLGTGKQVISWVHTDDLVSMFVTAIENDSMKGVYNAVAPEPVTNKELIRQLAKSRNRFFVPVRVPSFILRLVLGEMSTEVLKSATVSADKIISTGFTFRYGDAGKAISSLTQ